MKRKRRVLTYRSFFIDTFSRLIKQGITEEERTREAKRAREKKEANLSRSEQRSMRRPFEVQVELKSNVTSILLPVNMSSTSLFCVLFWTESERPRERERSDRHKERVVPADISYIYLESIAALCYLPLQWKTTWEDRKCLHSSCVQR